MTEQRDDEQYLPDYAQDEPRQGMGTGMKVFLILLGLGGVLMLVCCGGVFWFATRLQNSMTEDPAEIALIRDEIAPVAVPEGFKPSMGVNLNLFGFFQMQMAGFGGPDESFLLLMQMAAAGQQDQQVQQQFRQQAAQHTDAEKFRVESSETRTFEINGQECDFVFAKGTMPDSDEEYRQITGVFPGKGGVAFLIYLVSEEEWDEVEAESIVLSLDVNGAGRRIDSGEDAAGAAEDKDAADAGNPDADAADSGEADAATPAAGEAAATEPARDAGMSDDGDAGADGAGQAPS